MSNWLHAASTLHQDSEPSSSSESTTRLSKVIAGALAGCLGRQTLERRRKAGSHLVQILVTFSDGFRGMMPENDGAHEYLNAFLLSTCFRRCFRGLTSTHSCHGALTGLSTVGFFLWQEFSHEAD